MGLKFFFLSAVFQFVLLRTCRSYFIPGFLRALSEPEDYPRFNQEPLYGDNFGVKATEVYKMPMSSDLEQVSQKNAKRIFKGLGLVDKCRRNIADALLKEHDCQNLENLSEDQKKLWQMKFSLQLTNCHFRTHGKQTYPCAESGQDIQVCFSNVNESDFEVYTQFYLAAERICSELNHDRWQRSVEVMVETMYSSSFETSRNLAKLKSSSEILLSSQNELHSKNNEMQSSIFETSEKTHRMIDDQAVVLHSHLESSEKTALFVLEKQKEMALFQNESLRNIEQSTDNIGRLIDERVLTQISNLELLSGDLNSLLASNNFMLEQHTGLISQLTNDIDATLEKWKPLFDQILQITLNTNVNVSSLKFAFYYFCAAFGILFLTAFWPLRVVRLPGLMLLLTTYVLETTILPEMAAKSSRGSHIEKALMISTYGQLIRTGSWVGMLLLIFGRYVYALVAYFVGKSSSNLSAADAIEMLEDLNYTIWETNQRKISHAHPDAELITLLIDQLVKFRLKFQEEDLEVPPVSLELQHYLESISSKS